MRYGSSRSNSRTNKWMAKEMMLKERAPGRVGINDYDSLYILRRRGEAYIQMHWGLCGVRSWPHEKTKDCGWLWKDYAKIWLRLCLKFRDYSRLLKRWGYYFFFLFYFLYTIFGHGSWNSGPSAVWKESSQAATRRAWHRISKIIWDFAISLNDCVRFKFNRIFVKSRRIFNSWTQNYPVESHKLLACYFGLGHLYRTGVRT